MMKCNEKVEKGITLIALVITIIVLLILAGVSINLIAGNNGVINRATNAVDTNRKAVILEEAEMVLSGWQTDYLVNKTPYEGRSETTASEAIVSCTGGKVTVTDNRGKIVFEASFSETTGLGEWNEIEFNETDPNPSEKISVTGVTLSATNINLNVADKKQLTVIVEPREATNKSVTWNSDNKEVAIVSNDGEITVVGMGTATITVTTEDGNKKAQCTVIVETPYIHAGEYLVDVVDIGMYVSGGSVNGGNWRVLSKSGNGSSGVVKLISANCPIRCNYEIGKVETSVLALEDLTEEYANWKNINYVDKNVGCHAFGCYKDDATVHPTLGDCNATMYSPLNEIETLYQEITGQTLEVVDRVFCI